MTPQQRDQTFDLFNELAQELVGLKKIPDGTFFSVERKGPDISNVTYTTNDQCQQISLIFQGSIPRLLLVTAPENAQRVRSYLGSPEECTLLIGAYPESYRDGLLRWASVMVDIAERKTSTALQP
jgi:hypothetical protein